MFGRANFRPCEEVCACVHVWVHAWCLLFPTGLHFLLFFASKVVCGLLGGMVFNTHLSFPSVRRLLVTCFTIDT